MAGNGLARGLSGGGGEENPSASCPFCFCGRLGRLEEGPLLPLRRAEGGRGGGPLSLQAVLWRGRSRPVPAGAVWAWRAPLSAAPSPLHEGGVEGSGLFWRLGSPPGFPGIFALLSRGRFARRGETDADALLAGGMMGSLALSGRMRCPFARRESVWGEGRGCRAGSWPAVRGGPGAVPTGGTGLSGMEGESAAPARPRRGARRRGRGRLAPTARRRGGRRIAYGKRGGGLL